MISEPVLTRKELQELQCEPLHHARNRTKADVYLVEWPPDSGRQVVVKDMAARPLWFRVLAARYLMAREWAALCALKGIEGIPEPLFRPDADCFVMERVEGQPFSSLSRKDIPCAAVEALEVLMKEVHARGVTHGDLHSSNVLLISETSVGIIDWATASVFPAEPRGMRRWIFNEFLALDRRSQAKIRRRVAPQTLTPEHQTALQKASPIARFIRGLGDKIKPRRRGRKREA